MKFAAAMRNMQKDSLRGMWDNDWLPTISGKQVKLSKCSFYNSLPKKELIPINIFRLYTTAYPSFSRAKFANLTKL